jgi:hypothetical protein
VVKYTGFTREPLWLYSWRLSPLVKTRFVNTGYYGYMRASFSWPVLYIVHINRTYIHVSRIVQSLCDSLLLATLVHKMVWNVKHQNVTVMAFYNWSFCHIYEITHSVFAAFFNWNFSTYRLQSSENLFLALTGLLVSNTGTHSLYCHNVTITFTRFDLVLRKIPLL